MKYRQLFSRGWHYFSTFIFVPAVIIAVLVAPYLVIQAQQDIAEKATAREHAIANAIKDQADRTLLGVRQLLDRPVISIKTVRQVVHKKGVKTVVITKVITKVVTKTVVKWKTKIICKLPNGNPCPKTTS